MTIPTYKYKSKIATAVSFIAAFILYIGKDEIAKILPAEYAFLAGLIVLAAGYIASQGTENTRVKVAEQRVHEQYNDPAAEILNDEYVSDDDDI